MRPSDLSRLIDPDELRYEFFRASGPGGQNVNKVSTAVRLRFDVRKTRSLPADVKQRLASLAGSKLTEAGVLVIEARRYRTQEQNRQDATRRLTLLVSRAWRQPRPRRATQPTKAAKERRVEAKRRKGRAKSQRGSVRDLE